MANSVPLAYADVELQLASAVSAADTSFTLSSASDDDGTALPAGKYCFTVDNGSSNKEYLLGQLNGVTVTSVVSVSRQGVETSGAARAHRVGAPAILSDFATIQRVADILRGQVDLDGDNPIGYDAEPTLSSRADLATVAYVIDTAAGGTVGFDNMTTTGSAGETVADGDLVYFKTSDQEWYLTDADTSTTVDAVQLGIALGAGTDGVTITGGIQLAGTYTTTSLTAGSLYYAGNTAGAYTTSAGTTSRTIGIALSTTKLLIIPVTPSGLTALNVTAIQTAPTTQTYTSGDTWTKPSGLTRVRVEIWGGGGSGGRFESTYTAGEAGGGGGGGYATHWFEESDLSATETITIGAGGAAVSSGVSAVGLVGSFSSFGTLLYAYGGGGGGKGQSGAGGGGGGGQLVVGAGGGASGGAAGDYSATAGGTGDTAVVKAIGGAGGGGVADGGSGAVGGDSLYGGAGGGPTRSVSIAGGTSTYGGNGGASEYHTSGTGDGVTGTQPSGGGGAVYVGTGTGSSGAGGAGKIIVREYYL